MGATASDQRQDVEAHAKQCCCKPQPGGQQGAGSRVLVKFPDQLNQHWFSVFDRSGIVILQIKSNIEISFSDGAR